MTYYEIWQQEKYGNIIPETGTPELENGISSRDESERWIENQVEQIEQTIN